MLVLAVALPLVLAFATTAPALTIESPAFAPNASIPREYTCQGIDVSPALGWSGAPEEAKSLVLIVEDPDVPDPADPKRTWVHWVLYDLPATSTGLPRDAAVEQLPEGTRQGKNDWKQAGWGGPCPPIGRHRYQFKLYAVSKELGALDLPTARELEAAMEGHVAAEAVLVGTYEKAEER